MSERKGIKILAFALAGLIALSLTPYVSAT